MTPNEVVDKMNEVIQKCQEYRKKALKEYQTESAILRRDRQKMAPDEYRRLRLQNMRSYSETSKAFCLMTIAACEATIKQLEGENPYKAIYTRDGESFLCTKEWLQKGGIKCSETK